MLQKNALLNRYRVRSREIIFPLDLTQYLQDPNLESTEDEELSDLEINCKLLTMLHK
ncbi:MAG: hypothetical protein KME29_08860 [Calothrix sp. FI2-JRJ7]|nr:hypothetical protein [Calothrix sp. FI2-JRJ7]